MGKSILSIHIAESITTRLQDVSAMFACTLKKAYGAKRPACVYYWILECVCSRPIRLLPIVLHAQATC